MDVPSDSALLQMKTVERLREALRAGSFVAAPEVTRLVRSLSGRAFALTVEDLASILAQDAVVAAAVIASANTVGNNPTGRPVLTLADSIQMMGVDRVRHLAINMLPQPEKSLPEEAGEAAAFSLLCGFFAKELAERRFADGESAFVTAVLRGYGRILMAAFMTEEYLQGRDLFEEMGEDPAFREVFGVTPLDAGVALLSGTALPRELLRSLQKPSPLLLRVPTNRADDELLVMADFAVRFFDTALDATLDAAQFGEKLEALLSGYNASYRLNRDDVLEALAASIAAREDFDRRYSVARGERAAFVMARARATGENPPQALELAWVAARHRAAERRRAKAAQAEEARKSDYQLLEEALAQAEAAPAEKLPQALADAVAKALSLDGVVLLRFGSDGCECVAAAGPSGNSLRTPAAQVTAADRDVFGVALSRGEDILVSDVRLGNVSRYLPVWLKLNSPVMSLLVLPVRGTGGVEGLLFGIRGRGKPFEPSSRVLTALRNLRASLALHWAGTNPQDPDKSHRDRPRHRVPNHPSR